MSRKLTYPLLIMSIFAMFWAYIIGDGLLHEFSGSLTWIDLSVLFILGFVAGIGVGIALLVPRKSP
jgi:hypothetical protein